MNVGYLLLPPITHWDNYGVVTELSPEGQCAAQRQALEAWLEELPSMASEQGFDVVRVYFGLACWGGFVQNDPCAASVSGI
jgi:hypothetical protein